VDAELASFVDLLAEEHRASGLPAPEARRAALRDVGGLGQVREAIHESRPTALADRLRQDARDGLRFVRRAPALSAAIVLTLALGIGATAATFSVVDGVLLKPLAYPDAGRLVTVLHDRSGPVSPANFLDWQRAADGFTAMGAAQYWAPTLGGVNEPERIFALQVTPEVLPLVGVSPVFGRFPGSDRDTFDEVAIADGLWRRAFGADPGVLGRSILLNGAAHRIVGVMPPGFVFAPFWATRAEAWVPLDLRSRADSRNGQSLRVFARLSPNTNLERARAEMATITAELESRFPGTNRGVTVTSLKEMVVGDTRPALVALSAAVLLVLLIACANVAHLLLVRAAAREREVAVRAALGAPRGRLVRQFLTESLILALAGGAGGLLVASGAIRLVTQLGAASLPRTQAIVLDDRALAFTIGLSLITVLIFGIAPALAFARPTATAALRSAERGAGTGRRAGRARGVLMASEVALAIVLLAGASLLLRSFVTLRGVDAGWVPDRVASLVVSVAGTPDSAADRRLALFVRVRDALAALPSAASVSAINHLPIAGDIWGMPFVVRGRPEPRPGEGPSATFRTVLPGYFGTVDLPLARGRDFTDADRAGAAPVVIVNQRLADVHFHGEDPIGQQIQVQSETNPPWRTIVAVARNAVQQNLSEAADEEVYLPLLQDAGFVAGTTQRSSYLTFVIRTEGAPAAILPSARAAVRRVAPTAPISDVHVMTDVVRSATASARFTLVLIGLFAALALLLAAIGIYSVMSYAVSMRRREIGIRMALGATPRGIVGRIVGEGLIVTAAGGAIGLAVAVVAARAMSQLLFGVTPFDVPALAGAAAGLVAAATLASLLPARRASRIDPQTELR
jgi:putative ABC transport system permease protein